MGRTRTTTACLLSTLLAALAAHCASSPSKKPEEPKPAEPARTEAAPTPTPMEVAAPAPQEPSAEPPPAPPRKPAEETKATPPPSAPSKTASAPAPPKPTPPPAIPKPETTKAAAPGSGEGTISGKVLVLGLGGKPEASSAGAVIYLPGVTRAMPQEGKAVMTSHNKTFEPHVLAVSAGQSVDFPNIDKIHHNAFSLSDCCRFDLGLYKNGDSRSKTFDKEGVCRVYCNIHAQMSAIVLATKGNAFAVTAADGSYRIDGLPPGKHALVVWHEKAKGDIREEVEIAAGSALAKDFNIDTASFKETPHTNKYGKPYGKDDEARY